MERGILKSFLPLIGVAFPIFVVDQLTKWIIDKKMSHGSGGDGIVVIPGVFNIHHVRNSGAAFGIMGGQNFLLIAITIVAIGFIFLYYNHFRESMWMKIALGFLLGGALGNFADRLRLGYVIDFLQFKLDGLGFEWPTFNVADISVCIGAAMLIVHLFQRSGDSDATKEIEG